MFNGICMLSVKPKKLVCNTKYIDISYIEIKM